MAGLSIGALAVSTRSLCRERKADQQHRFTLPVCIFEACLSLMRVAILLIFDVVEEGIGIRMLARDIEHLRKSFASDKGESGAGKLILRNEHASKVGTSCCSCLPFYPFAEFTSHYCE